ncbi:MAG: M16 family metallopeptidase [Thermoanaerobaculia bacterium]
MSTTRSFPTPALAAALLAALVGAPLSGQTKEWDRIPKPPLHKFSIPQPKKIVFGNGMTVFLMEDRELPLIDAFITIKGGSRNEPAAKAGLAALFGQVWRTGGTKARTGDQLDDLLEARAAMVETGSDIDSARVSLSCLKGDFDTVLGVFDEVLKSPELRADKLALAKTQARSGISRRNDNPLGIAEREATRLGYGADSPYARQIEYATVDAVTREDLLAWHQKYVHPDRAILAVVGDFDTAAMEARLRKTFGSWPKGKPVEDPPAAFRTAPVPGVYFVAKDDVNQSNIRMVAAGIRRDNPDYFAVEVLNEVFGGGFAARLFSNIRSKKGLAYSVGGGLRSSFDHPGLLRLTMGTKSETTAAGIDALLEEVQNIVAQPATEEELKRARDAILNSFIFRFDSKEKILREQAAYAFYGYPADFLDRYRREIEKVSAADVARVAKKYVRKEDLAILVVGKAADFDRPLASFGKVTPIDIAIPAGGAGTKAAAPASAGDTEAGRSLFAKVVEGLGGAQKVAAARDVQVKGQTTVKTPQGEMALGFTSLTVFPDKVHQEIRAPFGQITTVLTPQAAFMASPMGNQDLPASAREEQARDLARLPLVLAQRAADPKLTVAAAGKEKVGEVEAAVLDVSFGDAAVRWFVDPASGRILRSAHTATGQQGPARRVTDYSDYRSVEGLFFAFKQESTVNGEKAQSMTVEEVKVNSNPDPKIFEKPAPKETPK